MNRHTRVSVFARVVAISIPSLTWAHEGHEHKKVMGTISTIQGQHLDVTTADGKHVSVMLTDKTTFMHGQIKMADGKMLKAGDRVVI